GSEGVGPATIAAHVGSLQQRFLDSGVAPGELLPPLPHRRGSFLTFRTGHAGDRYRRLHEQGVVTDYRRDRLRIGFGVYHDQADVDRRGRVLPELCARPGSATSEGDNQSQGPFLWATPAGKGIIARCPWYRPFASCPSTR